MEGFVLKRNCQNGPELSKSLLKPLMLKDEALIRILRAGICATDIEIANGYKDDFEGILGHEFVGIVEDVWGPNKTKQKWLKQRVVGEINIVCNECQICNDSSKLGMQRNHCSNRSCLGIIGKDGAFAEYITLPLKNLYIVPESISNSHAVFVEPLAAAYRIVEQNVIREEDKVGIIGDGKLGLLTAEVLVHGLNKQISISMIGKHPNKMQLGFWQNCEIFVDKWHRFNKTRR